MGTKEESEKDRLRFEEVAHKYGYRNFKRCNANIYENHEVRKAHVIWLVRGRLAEEDLRHMQQSEILAKLEQRFNSRYIEFKRQKGREIQTKAWKRAALDVRKALANLSASP